MSMTVYCHPYPLSCASQVCCFCHRREGLTHYPVAEKPDHGWICCPTESCIQTLALTQAEQRRRLTQTLLGNSREPIVYFTDDSDSDW